MSAILGLIRLDGSPVAAATLEAMRGPMACWGPDRVGLWTGGPAGLGQLVLRVTPEDAFENLPAVTPGSGVVVTAAARLDNRAELCAALGVSAADSPSTPPTPDGRLILLAFEKWGEECPSHLLGDWAFAAWDPVRRKLFLARDHHGNTALYYHAGFRTFCFASCMGGLLALPEVPREIDEIRLTQLLAIWWDEGARTIFREVFRLPPAHCLVVDTGGVRLRRYWRLEDAPAVRLGSDGEYVEAFLDIYGEAVRARLRSARPVGATLSAGLDSGSVVALAAPGLRGRGAKLTAFTSVPHPRSPGPGEVRWLADEWPLAQLTARKAGVVDHVAIPAEDETPIGGLERSLELHVEPQFAASNAFWIQSLLGEAQRRGIGVVLTGQLGNGGISWPGDRSRVLRLLAGGRLLRAAREVANYRIDGRPSWLRGFRALVLGPLLGPLRDLMPDRRGGSPWGELCAINPDFAARVELGQRMRAAGFDWSVPDRSGPREWRFDTLLPGAYIGGAIWHENGAGYGLDVRDPTADRRLLDFCLGIPDEQYSRGGRDRSLVRRAMEGLLPPEVQLGTRRGLQASDLGHRLVAARDEVEGALERVAGSPLAREYLDLGSMRKTWSELLEGVTPKSSRRAATLLLRGLLVGLFLVGEERSSK